MEKYALDTDLLVEFLRGREPAVSVMKNSKRMAFWPLL